MDGVNCSAPSANSGQVADHNKLATKTGTTICGLLTREGVVLAADCRATAGSFIATRNCLKLHRLSKSIWCAGAGVAADLHHVTENIAANLQLLKASLGAEVRIEACVRMLSKVLREHHGNIIVALIVAGINPDGTMDLVYVDSDGSTLRADFLAMGSGGFFARSMLENGYRKDLTLQEGVELAADAIEAGILNDLGSGSNVDVLSISLLDSANPVLRRPYRQPVKHMKASLADYSAQHKKVVVLEEKVNEVPRYDKNEMHRFLQA